MATSESDIFLRPKKTNKTRTKALIQKKTRTKAIKKTKRKDEIKITVS